MSSCLLKPVKPRAHRWTVEELAEMLGAPPSWERFDRGYVIVFAERPAVGSTENLASCYVTRGERTASGPAVIMHMDEMPASWWAEYAGEEEDND